MGTERIGFSTYDKLIEEIYESALDPERWCGALTSVARYLGCPIVAVVPLYDPASAYFSTGMESGAKPYADYWWEKDCIAHTAVQRQSKGLVCDWDLLGWERIKTDPFYQEFRRELGIGHCCAFVSEIDPGASLAMSAHFDIGHIPSIEDLGLIQVIARHVNRAVAIQERTAARAARARIDELLSVLGCAAALIDDTGRILHRNLALRKCEGDGFQIVDGRLTCSRAADQAALDLMIRNIRRPGQVSDPNLVLVTRPSGLRPFMVRTMPLSASRFEIAGSAVRRQALMLIVDLESESLSRPDAPLRRLGLSPTEARIAALVGSGYTLRDAAIQQGVTEGTIRQQLKSVFSKLGIARQAELVVLVSKLSLLRA